MNVLGMPAKLRNIDFLELRFVLLGLNYIVRTGVISKLLNKNPLCPAFLKVTLILVAFILVGAFVIMRFSMSVTFQT